MIRTLVRAGAVLALLLPASLALAADTVHMTSPAIFSVNGYELDVTSTAEMSSTTVTATSLLMTLTANSSATITQPSLYALSVDSSSASIAQTTCDSSTSKVVISGAAGATVTITPLATVCGAAAASTGSNSNGPVASSGGGGGGGGSVVPYSTPAVTTPAAAATPGIPATAASLQAQLAALQAQLGAAGGGKFTALTATSLVIGRVNSQVKTLQQMLNSDPDTRVAAIGPGSPGKETTMYGSLTQAAIKKFQKKYGIVSSGTPSTTGYGALGPKTRAQLNALFGK